MWIFSTSGFFSITASPEDASFMQIRARERHDLEALLTLTGMDAEIIETPNADYRFRLIVTPHAVGGVLLALGNGITYSNFKGAIAKTPDQAHKEPGLHRIWSIHRDWQPRVDFPKRAHGSWLDIFDATPTVCTSAIDEPGNLPVPDEEPCDKCGHPRNRHNHRKGACMAILTGHRFCDCSRWKRKALTVTPPPPTSCPHCDYDEADGGLIEQCANCKAADAGPAAVPLHNPREQKPGRKSRGKLADVIAKKGGDK